MNITKGWQWAVGLCERYFKAPCKSDVLLAQLPEHLSAMDRRRCRYGLLGVLRHLRLLEWVVGVFLSRPARPRLRAILYLGALDLWEAEASRAPVLIDHAVTQAGMLVSQREAGLVNAVLRRVAERLYQLRSEAVLSMADRALRYSHPDWLVERWTAQFGAEATTALLKWNQEPSPVFVRRTLWKPEAEVFDPMEFGLATTAWPGFFRFCGSDWKRVEALLKEGRAYVQDPATRRAPELLDVRPGEVVLDVCAAPGGKSLQLLEFMAGSNEGLLVVLDRPGVRLRRLQRNVSTGKRLGAYYEELPGVHVLAGDARELEGVFFKDRGLPQVFDAVLLDAPCSNTGVLRRRPDAKWRLRSESIGITAELQRTLLARAAALVRPGGRLVYSTCSIEAEENSGVVEAFLDVEGQSFCLESSQMSYPWISGCDGGGAFLFVRSA